MSRKKKILILSMSCNQNLFMNEEKIIKDTWGEDIINGLYDNIKLYFYTSSTDGTYSIDKDKHKIYVDSKDDLFSTWDKTLKPLRIVNQYKIDYDYIFRTNTSTYINVPLLDAFVQSLSEDDDKIYGGMIDAPKQTTSPYEHCCYAQGNAILLKKKYIDIIINQDNYINFRKNDEVDRETKWNRYIYCVDDNVIGGILNRWFIDREINIYSMYRDFRFCYKITTPNDQLHKYIAVSLKSTQPREPFEYINYMHLHSLFVKYYKSNNVDLSLVSEALSNPYIIKIKDGYGYDGIYRMNDFIEMLIKNNSNIKYLDKVQI